MGFHVGQKVVCVDDKFCSRGCLVAGSEYECFEVKEDWLKVNCCSYHNCPGPDGFWLACRFRPVISRETDISVFTALLNTTKHKEPA